MTYAESDVLLGEIEVTRKISCDHAAHWNKTKSIWEVLSQLFLCGLMHVEHLYTVWINLCVVDSCVQQHIIEYQERSRNNIRLILA